MDETRFRGYGRLLHVWETSLQVPRKRETCGEEQGQRETDEGERVETRVAALVNEGAHDGKELRRRQLLPTIAPEGH